ncbi:RHS repeat-associated core domain-containing protein, partial [Vibrio hyugaensis]|uniref:RHS repeat-associated core domain-containing protein n=1 Tax=Vibrio hyugaensis TaxID=1534743 RepID=UPI0011B0568A
MYSSAHSNINLISGQPDPQTGLYSFAYPVGDFLPSYGFGPSLSLQLTFNSLSSLRPISNPDENPLMLGAGWQVNLTQYSSVTERLSLGTGQSYVRLGETDGEWSLDYALKDIRITEDSENIYVYHKDGTLETLAYINDSHDAAHVRTIRNAAGRTVYFDYTFKNGVNLLSALRDEESTLLEVTYRDGMTTFTCYPGTSKEAVSTVYYGESIDKIVSPLGEETRFEYEKFEQNDYRGYLLTQVNYADGAQETVYYNNRLDLPLGAPISYQPSLSQHVRTNAGASPDIITDFRFGEDSDFNYWGNNSGANWNDNRDTLAEYDGSYAYQCSTVCGDKRTRYHFNKFHQLLEQVETTDDIHIKTTRMSYFGDDSLPQSQQVDVRYLLMSSTVTEVTAPEGTRTFEQAFDYDEWGNMLAQTEVSGVTHRLSYYPPEGDGNNCPAHPFGFSSFPKEKVAVSADGRREKHYNLSYRAIPSVDGTVDNVRLSSVMYGDDTFRLSYFKPGDTGGIQGELKQLSASVDGTATLISMHYAQDDDSLQQTRTLTGADDLSVSQHSTISRWTGDTLAETNSEGVLTTYSYDLSGRLVTRTHASGTDYENTISLVYDNLPDVANLPDGLLPIGKRVQVHTPFGVTHVYVDGEQKKLFIYKKDEHGKMKKVTESNYDEQGRPSSEMVWDYAYNEGKAEPQDSFSNSIQYTYGVWGEVAREKFHDGTVMKKEVDPVTMTVRGSVAKRGRALPGTLTTLDLFGNPVSQVRLTAAGEAYSETTLTYDGFGNQKKVVTPTGRTTYVETRDKFDRPLSIMDYDGSRHVFRYLDGSIGAMVASTSTLPGANLGKTKAVTRGTQSYDGLRRIVDRSVNGISRQYEYASSSSVPSSLTNGRGQQISVGFIPEIGALSHVKTASDAKRFSYATQSGEAAPSGALLGACCDNGSYAFEYSPEGRLKKVTQSPAGITDSVVETTQYLLTGAPLERQLTDRVMRSELDIWGRLAASSDSDIQTRVERDDFGRVETINTYQEGELKQKTTIAYDDYSREIQRVTTSPYSEDTFNIDYEYDTEDRLVSRFALVGNLTLKEFYEYDEKSRLITYTTGEESSDDMLPCNEYGRPITGQSFDYDGLDNLTRLVTTFPNGESDTAVCHYDLQRLTHITHSLTVGNNAYPAEVLLTYDEDGNLTGANAGETVALDYNELGQMTRYNDTSYHYDALARLQLVGESHRDYVDDTVMTVRSDNTQVEYVRHAGTPIAERRDEQPRWLMTDNKMSVTAVTDSAGTTCIAYTPSGEGGNTTSIGFNGELKDPVSGGYLLGNGTRLYLPMLGGFTSMDSLSPFSAGGLNPYRYCNGDPVNLTDPSGHMAQGGTAAGIFGIAAGILGLLFTIPTGGASLSISAMAGIGLEAAGITASAANLARGAGGSGQASRSMEGSEEDSGM